MGKLKNEKGAITILVLVSVLFMISFLISSYIIIANKVQTQKEIIGQTRSIYENYNMEDIYNSYFGKNVIPISNVEQLLAIGTDIDMLIDSSYYNFANNDRTVYLLMNDIQFNAYEEETLMDSEGNYYWEPIGQKTNFFAGFEGNGNEIRVGYKDRDNQDYTVVYLEDNNYAEPEYKVKISPKILSEDGEVENNASIWVSYDDEEFSQAGQGETEISVKRLVNTKIKATCSGYKDSGTASIYIENPEIDYNTEKSLIDLVLGKYSFTINATPSNAKVTINGVETNTVSLNKGEQVIWKVEATDYITQEGSQTIDDDSTINISLNKIRYTLEIQPSPSDSTVVISSNGTTLKNGTGNQTVEVDIGTPLSYSVNKTYYYAQSGNITMNSNSTIPVTLSAKPEQTMVLSPSSVSSSFNASNNANNTEANTDNFAYSTGRSELVWNFNASSLNSNAKINSIVIKYRLGTTVAGTKGEITLRANGTSYFTKTTESLNLLLVGAQYEDTVQTLPSAENIKKSLTLSANKSNSGLAYFRCYGASITIKYVDP